MPLPRPVSRPVSHRQAHQPPLLRLGLVCGLLGPALWAAAIALAGELRPGFDHVGQYISELGERGSTTELFMRFGGFVGSGVLIAGYAAAFQATVARVTARPWLTLLVAALIAADGIGRIGAGIFPCEPGCAAPEVISQRLHGLSATIAFLSLAAAALLSAVLFRRDTKLRPLSIYSFASGCTGLIFLALMSASEATHIHTGLHERLASGVLTLWVFVTASRLRKLGRT
ncbi:DUF998 domain-containing protein [Dechloromonas sp. XY25]|uniref:DUF998 domain-containing protein n=1 Tax=Dechloromonas hankyongensis TaxID=2908002 RepID=A0ABS9K1C2_9RHOO|nr:DUF998 domain-containing protein [Dechloromonas hankyongensis]MCG2576962.1 DUF998 domain-containing protein [Dechloromonas hankyongensis]